jgi:hypothetical protein
MPPPRHIAILVSDAADEASMTSSRKRPNNFTDESRVKRVKSSASVPSLHIRRWALQKAPLLRLPGEIRNRIYKYVFSDVSSASGLKYCEASYHLKYISFDPMFSTENTRPVPAFFLVNEEFNQMKYVCRQLYFECKALELKYAPLIFTGNRLVEPSLQFLTFVERCTPAKASWIRQVKLYGSTYSGPRILLDDIDIFQELVEFCRANPKVHVDYVLQEMQLPTDFDGVKRFLVALAFLEAIRGRDLRRVLPFHAERKIRFSLRTAQTMAARWLRERTAIHANSGVVAEKTSNLEVQNLKFRPAAMNLTLGDMIGHRHWRRVVGPFMVPLGSGPEPWVMYRYIQKFSQEGF